jgi:Glycogen debranching enzyme
VTTLDDVLARLRAGDLGALPDGPLRAELAGQGVGFAAIGGPLEARWRQALLELHGSIRPLGDAGDPVLTEGGPYPGTWIESTGSISTEVLTRFAPRVARATSEQFATHQRADGLLPYKVVDAGPGFTQIQLVTPFARTVWNHYLLTGRDTGYLRRMYAAMTRMDAWLVEYRNTRGTGGVEAFGTFDTGHDLSPRFWFVPDRPLGDATKVDPTNPILPFVAPDLTANVAAQRAYLALIAAELGEDPAPWERAAAESVEALFAQCFDERDGIFYDRDATGELRRVQSDVLLRVLECEIGDDAFFAAALDRYLLHTGKFLAHYGFTSLALDDPRFDADAGRNSWGGPVNFLSLIRAPHPFEHHGRVAELALTAAPVLAAVALADRFAQCIDPWSGAPGFTSEYSPSILWFLDAIERHAGILPRPDGRLWFSGMPPTRLDHGAAAQAVGYSRVVDGARFELVADDRLVRVLRDGEVRAEFPHGWRLVTDRTGHPEALVGLAGRPVTGSWEGAEVTLAPNEVLDLATGARRSPGFTPPRA